MEQSDIFKLEEIAYKIKNQNSLLDALTLAINSPNDSLTKERLEQALTALEEGYNNLSDQLLTLVDKSLRVETPVTVPAKGSNPNNGRR